MRALLRTTQSTVVFARRSVKAFCHLNTLVLDRRWARERVAAGAAGVGGPRVRSVPAAAAAAVRRRGAQGHRQAGARGPCHTVHARCLLAFSAKDFCVAICTVITAVAASLATASNRSTRVSSRHACAMSFYWLFDVSVSLSRPERYGRSTGPATPCRRSPRKRSRARRSKQRPIRWRCCGSSSRSRRRRRLRRVGRRSR